MPPCANNAEVERSTAPTGRQALARSLSLIRSVCRACQPALHDQVRHGGAAYRTALRRRATRALAQGWWTKPVPRQGHNTPLPLKRSPPASFKRLLGGTSADCKARCSEEIGECAQVILGDGVLLEVLPQCLGAEPSFQKRVESWGAPNVRPKFAPKLVGHTG